jgi:hypothetical protein
MSEERALILQMLTAGRVTVEQADQLLEALGAASPTGPHEPATGTRRQRQWDERTDDFFANLTPKQLTKLRNHGVSGAYVQQLRAAGLGGLSVDDLIALYEHDVTPRFVRDLREAGFTALAPAELVALYDHGVDAAFVREMRGVGLSEATPAQLIALYDHGVDAAFVREMHELGFAYLAPDALIHLRNHGVDSDLGCEAGGLYRSSRSEREESGT